MAGPGRARVTSAAEASGCLVAPPVFKTGEPRAARLAGSIPVRLRHLPGNGCPVTGSGYPLAVTVRQFLHSPWLPSGLVTHRLYLPVATADLTVTETLSCAGLTNVAWIVMPAWLRTSAPESKFAPLSTAA